MVGPSELRAHSLHPPLAPFGVQGLLIPFSCADPAQPNDIADDRLAFHKTKCAPGGIRLSGTIRELWAMRRIVREENHGFALRHVRPLRNIRAKIPRALLMDYYDILSVKYLPPAVCGTVWKSSGRVGAKTYPYSSGSPFGLTLAQRPCPELACCKQAAKATLKAAAERCRCLTSRWERPLISNHLLQFPNFAPREQIYPPC